MPRYVLPKPKKLKMTNVSVIEGYMAYNGYYGEFIPMSIMEKLHKESIIINNEK